GHDEKGPGDQDQHRADHDVDDVLDVPEPADRETRLGMMCFPTHLWPSGEQQGMRATANPPIPPPTPPAKPPTPLFYSRRKSGDYVARDAADPTVMAPASRRPMRSRQVERKSQLYIGNRGTEAG